MICKETQNTIDTLLRLKTNEDLAVDTINKIASAVTTQSTNNKTGEIAELQNLLKFYIHKFNL
jgi:hypothetical protein